MVVIITGSSRGIGRETARELARRGVTVVLNGRTPERLDATLEELRAAVPDGTFSAVACDIATEDGARALIRHTVETWGRVDGLIANAGVSMRGAVADLHSSTLDRLTTGNVHSAVLPTVAVLPELLKTHGAVIFVSTVAALHGFPGVSLYSASKAAVGTFAESLTAEVSRRGVHVGTVYLGFVENDPDKTTLGADGTVFHHERRAMQSQSDAAAAIVRALLRRKRRTITVGAGTLLDIAHRIAPRVVTRVLARSGGRIHSVDGHD
ncbi:MAG: SDR family NAD(P)-dependent oxidoreductase [Alkalispirochaeta sp.]